MLLGLNEAYSIYRTPEKTQKIPGEIAEVGVYKGGSAKIICEAKGEKSLHLFDTFEGIPEIDLIDSSDFYSVQFAESLENVTSYLKNYNKVYTKVYFLLHQIQSRIKKIFHLCIWMSIPI